MILVDSSVWIDYFRVKNPLLEKLLIEKQVSTHPFIIGELACGGLKSRKKIIEWLSALPKVVVAENEEVMNLIENNKLSDRGVGFIDLHLLASTLMSDCLLWTSDKKLAVISMAFGVGFRLPRD